ncbi:MAG: nucleoside diphosphate kinase regulator [Bacteroidales bacterium]|nr:nucleoside diphosphate kinase regulator [Bacteroidales bacterium]
MKSSNKAIVVTQRDYNRLMGLLSNTAKGNKGSADNLARLAGELARARQVESEKISPDVVTMNTIIEFMDLDNQITKQLKLVYPSQADIRQGHVSITAPIGTALLGYRKGDVVEWDVPAGKKKFLIKEILYQPEANGQFSI